MTKGSGFENFHDFISASIVLLTENEKPKIILELKFIGSPNGIPIDGVKENTVSSVNFGFTLHKLLGFKNVLYKNKSTFLNRNNTIKFI